MFAYVLLKQARWTKHLPEVSRLKADAILAARSYEKLQGRLAPPLASMLKREQRLQNLLNAANIDDITRLPRITGGDPRIQRGKLTRVERALYAPDKELAQRVQTRGKLFMPTKHRLPKDPPIPVPIKEKARSFFSDLGRDATRVKNYAVKHNRKLMAAGAVAAALGLGTLGVHAATKKRHEKIRGGTASDA